MNDDEFNDDLLDIDSDSEDTIDTLYEDEDYLDEPSFGEEEHNTTKDENGHYDRKYYANRQKELDEEVNKADSERHLNDKLNKNYHEGDDPQNKYVNKNAYDKAKDNINYAKAKKNQINNKIADAKNKAYMATHPGELAKEKTEEAGDNLKNKVKNKLGIPSDTKEAVKKVAVSTGKKIGQFFLTPQGLFIISIFAFVIFIILIILLFFGDGGSSKNKRIGLYGYDYYESEYNCTNVIYNGQEMSIDDYAAHVVSAEVGYYPFETQKAIAVAARSYALQNKDNIKTKNDGTCYVDVTNISQAYNEDVTDENVQAAEETRGLIITVNNVPKGNYDESCVYTAEQAKVKEPNGNFSDNYYYIRYGEETIGGYNFQPIEYEKAEEIKPLLKYLSDAINGSPCNGNHGLGLSQSGSWYLEKNEGYTWEEIIDYYYQNKEEIKSLYHTYEVSSNWTDQINLSSESLYPAVKLQKPINEIMSESEYNEINDLILASVLDAGVGTRDALVTAGVIPIKVVAEEYGVIIPYTYSGGHGHAIYNTSGKNIDVVTSSHFGLNPYWGSYINAYVYPPYGPYYYYGPDCSAWVAWIYNNAGIRISSNSSGGFYNLISTRYPMDGEYIAVPGDVLVNPGSHVVMVVGVDEDAGVYYVSESAGGKGPIISRWDMINSNYTILDMTEYISSHQIEDYENKFKSGVLNFK